MSRSYRKHPIGGIASADSEKYDKRKANRKFRKLTRQMLDAGLDDEDIPVDIREVSNSYTFDKDGKRYYDRDTIEEYPDIMRK